MRDGYTRNGCKIGDYGFSVLDEGRGNRSQGGRYNEERKGGDMQAGGIAGLSVWCWREICGRLIGLRFLVGGTQKARVVPGTKGGW